MRETVTLRAIIVDDEKRGISSLKQVIEKYIDGVRVIAECTKAADAIELIEVQKPEIVFLDINMPGMNGFDLLEKLSWKNFNLVFTTAHEEYALKALKNNAIDYLLKPISNKDLAQTIDRIREKLSGDIITVRFNYHELFSSLRLQKNHILVNSGTDVESIDVNNIVYLESRSNYTDIILCDAKEISTRKTLKEFESRLCVPGSNYMRVHHSYIINLNKVCRYLKTSGDIVMSNDQRIPLSKSKRDTFFTWLNPTV